jgi:ubiquinone/menaquinone biosynthesis C-methylase UbiE
VADVETTFRWLDRADSHPRIQEVKRRMLDLCPVQEGQAILDVGCGIGHEALRLDQSVGPTGRVVGIDRNPPMIAEARKRAADQAANVTFEIVDAHQLPFPDDTFDLCRTERVLRYVERPVDVIREMTRVVRPGGQVLAFDFDSDQTIVNAPNQALAQSIAMVLDAAVPHPWIGRQLFGLFNAAGLVDVRVVPQLVFVTGAAGFAAYQQLTKGTIARAVEQGQLDADEAESWWVDLQRAADSQSFFSANLGIIIAGRKE